MKIQHWAIIFLIIILPFSIVCRNVIKKKILVLNDETRYNNIIDNATFDAVAQIKESGAAFNLMNKFSKNVPLNEYIMDASVDRFFNTLCVNFNLPSNRTQAESYFCRYIPAIIFIGYDGLFVYSCEETGAGYEFRLKPKIPYAYNYNGVLINFTLDNYVKIYAPSSEAPFAQGFPLADDSSTGTYIIGGYVGNEVDFNYNGNNDLSEPGASTNPPGITPSIDPYALTTITNKTWVEAVRQDLAVYSTDSANNEGNLSYFLYAWGQASNWSAGVPNKLKNLLITDRRSSFRF